MIYSINITKERKILNTNIITINTNTNIKKKIFKRVKDEHEAQKDLNI